MQHILRHLTLPVAPESHDLWLAFFRTVILWHRRGQERRQLARFGERQLADIGLSRADQWQECRKPFWQV